VFAAGEGRFASILIGCAKTDGPITRNITGSFCIVLLANTAWPSYRRIARSISSNIHLRLFGKHVVDFLFVLIELFLGVMAEALRVKIDWNRCFARVCQNFQIPNFCAEGRPPPIIYIWIDGHLPYNFVAEDCHTKKLCNGLSSSEVRFYTENGCFALLSPLLGAQGQHTMFILGSLESA